jgi:release factor glutamine methyltransferase
MTIGELKSLLEGLLQSHYDAKEARAVIRYLVREKREFSELWSVWNVHNAVPNAEWVSLLMADVARLRRGEPVQYVTGSAWFDELEFEVNSSVLIPRPESEELVHLALAESLNPKRVIDICTGSGCIAVAFKKRRPAAEVMATDVSEAALKMADRNAEKNAARVDFIRWDLINDPDPFSPEFFVDVVLSNPPYIPESEKPDLARGVAEHEPALALFVPGGDPLLFYRHLLEWAGKHLNHGGKAIFELSAAHALDCLSLAHEKGWKHALVKKDLSGNYRFLVLTGQ